MKYFIADLHIGDPSALKYRPQFVSLGYHDEFMLNLLANLKPNDEVDFVGDCFVKPYVLPILAKMPFKKRLILGNHDLQKGIKWTDFVGVVDDIQGGYNWPGHPFWITHIPCHPDHLRGRLNIHGHLHDTIIPDIRFINVSVEATGYRLVDHEEILDGSYRTSREIVVPYTGVSKWKKTS